MLCSLRGGQGRCRYQRRQQGKNGDTWSVPDHPEVAMPVAEADSYPNSQLPDIGSVNRRFFYRESQAGGELPVDQRLNFFLQNRSSES